MIYLLCALKILRGFGKVQPGASCPDLVALGTGEKAAVSSPDFVPVLEPAEPIPGSCPRSIPALWRAAGARAVSRGGMLDSRGLSSPQQEQGPPGMPRNCPEN